MTDSFLIKYVPINGFLPWLAAGWRFCGLVVEPMHLHHGFWSCLMEREDG
jgi:hypothetical protein